MSTILGPAPCHTCRAHVWVVRRTVEVPCEGCGHIPGPESVCTASHHLHAIPDVAWTVVEADGERHICPAAAA